MKIGVYELQPDIASQPAVEGHCRSRGLRAASRQRVGRAGGTACPSDLQHSSGRADTVTSVAGRPVLTA